MSASHEAQLARIIAARHIDAHGRRRPRGAQWIWIALAFVVGGGLLAAPVIVVLIEATRDGFGKYVDAITHEHTLDALKLTLTTVAFALVVHFVLAVAFAWATTRFRLKSRPILTSLVDLPFTVSPVVAGLGFVLVFGSRGWMGPWLAEHDIRILYAVPSVILATLFVTLPFLPRELSTAMEAQGAEQEAAAASLGGSLFTILRRVTLPRVRWALLYGGVLCGARAAGEFGAVSVVSGHLRGETNTLPLHVEILYNEYDFVAAFAVASMLAAVGLIALVLKRTVERIVGSKRTPAAPFVPSALREPASTEGA